ncbi:hypothetical protein H6P81_013645 [Aristolochia fimbriata]|uniref:Uncharacterized protein n=1 Tax=Aristolochia fimbriata TaxID=158543 RepID=A0AAV7EFA2_ARIFI|nr:hypothetical protein H6P81_013645 [Aristolochia fimbriata]
MQEHLQHLRKVFEALRGNSLFVKKEKCSFGFEEVSFLGHWIRGGPILMDKANVQAISKWTVPTKERELRSFLGLVNYYRRFIKGFSAMAAPLTDLLKKKQKWDWTNKCQSAFEALKQEIVKEPVLRLPDLTKPFKVHTDASNFAIGGVLEQEGHPIAFERRKLNETEQRYIVQEREMTAIVHCLRTWRHYLLGSRFVVKTDNVPSSYFLTQKKLSPKQARWQDFLAEFDMELEYKTSKTNSLVDALSRKADLAAMRKEVVAATSHVSPSLIERIHSGLRVDTQVGSLLQSVMIGGTRKFWLDDGLLKIKGGRLYVPKHDGHSGQRRIIALVTHHFYWSGLEEDVEEYVRTCLVCQQDKVERRRPGGLLDPLPIPSRPWESVSMDFISNLRRTEGVSAIMVVVDRFSKYGTFVVVSADCTAEEAAKAFMSNIVKHWGVPCTIINDRDLRFTGKLAYKVQLPKRMKIHNVFHVSNLKHFYIDPDPSRITPARAPLDIFTTFDAKVEYIIADRKLRQQGKPRCTEYLVKWHDLPKSETTWQEASELWQFEKEVQAYQSGTQPRTTALLRWEHDTRGLDATPKGCSDTSKPYLIGTRGGANLQPAHEHGHARYR